MNPVVPNIPAPTIFETTSAVALTRPSCLSSPLGCAVNVRGDTIISHHTPIRAGIILAVSNYSGMSRRTLLAAGGALAAGIASKAAPGAASKYPRDLTREDV